jgi:hypothetical protein
MSGRRNRGNKAQPQPQKGQPQVKQEPSNPLLDLIKELLLQGTQKYLPQDKQPKAPQLETIIKTIEKECLQFLKESRTSEDRYSKFAIKVTMFVQTQLAIDATLSKKVVCLIFSFLLDEVQKNWANYKIAEADVHPDHHPEKDDDEEDDDDDEDEEVNNEMKDMPREEFDAWQKAFNYLNVNL